MADPLAPLFRFTSSVRVVSALGGRATTLATKAELVAQVKQLQRSLDRANRSLDDAKKKITTLGRSVTEGREREKATAEILAVISRSPTDGPFMETKEVIGAARSSRRRP